MALWLIDGGTDEPRLRVLGGVHPFKPGQRKRLRAHADDLDVEQLGERCRVTARIV